MTIFDTVLDRIGRRIADRIQEPSSGHQTCAPSDPTALRMELRPGDGRHARLLKVMARVELLILDDWGLASLTPDQGRDMLEIVDDRHGRGSTIITSQLAVEHWHEAIANPTIADAILDRLVHNAHRLNLAGESIRKTAAKRSQNQLGT